MERAMSFEEPVRAPHPPPHINTLGMFWQHTETGQRSEGLTWGCRCVVFRRWGLLQKRRPPGGTTPPERRQQLRPHATHHLRSPMSHLA